MFQAARRLSIQWKLPLLVTAVMSAVMVVLLIAAHRQVQRISAATVTERLEATTVQLAASVHTSSSASEREAQRLASLPEVAVFLRKPTEQARQQLFAVIDQRAQLDTTIVGVAVYDLSDARLDLHGRHSTTLAQLPVPDHSRRSSVSPDSAAVGPLMAVGGSVVYPVVAIVSDRGQRLGLFVLWRTVYPKPIARAQIAALFGSGSRLVLGSPGGAWTDQVDTVAEPAVPFTTTTHPIHTGQTAKDGFLTSVAHDSLSGWVTVLQVPDSVILAPANRFILQVGLLGAALVLLGGALVWGLGRGIAIPVYQVTEAAAAMGVADHGARIAIQRDDEIGRLALAFNQMADRVEMEAEARVASETQWRLLFRDNPYPMWVYDPATLRFLAVNEAAIRQYGYSREEFFSITLADIRPPEHIAALMEDVADAMERNFISGIWRHRRKDGGFFDVEVTGNSVEFAGSPARLVLAKDITSRRQLELQLLQSQKMEAVGRLAGGVAHDFNNLLAVILTYTELVRLEIADDDPRAADLDEVKAAAERATALTRQLLTFSRKGVVQTSLVDPGALVRGFEKMLRRLIGEDIQVETRLTPEAGTILADPSQFEQVLLNLAVNARDAMPGGGVLAIAVEPITIDEASRELHGLPEAGEYVMVSVSDTGVGMTAEVRAQLFEPFFTTKEVGRGTGLGLTTVYAIVTQAGGSVSVYSEPDRGSTFRLYFPAVGSAPGGRKPISGSLPTVGGSETILLVEDDAAVRAAAIGALKRLGYTVLATEGADAAIELFNRNSGAIDLIVSDVVMPGTDGPTLLKRFREIRPDLKAVLMSGYTGDSITSRGVMESGIPFLQKPFTISRLGQVVREALDSQ